MKIEIFENSSYTLNSEYVNEFQKFLKDNSGLPMELKDSTIIFDNYTIGSLQIKGLVINIQPRITNLTVNHYFEMQLYNEGLLNDNITSLLSENSSYGIQENLISLFLNEALELVNLGVEGSFVKVREETNKIRGKILVDQISPVNLFQDRVPVEYEIHTLDTSFNKIIRLALDKIRVLDKNTEQVNQYAIVNSYFDQIDAELSEYKLLLQENEQKLYYENNKYPIVLGLAKKILENLKVNLKNNEVASSSYLVNSNNLFEKYSRKVLTEKLSLKVSKWEQPKKMGQFTINKSIYVKSYIPDIMIDFHNDTIAALAVLDAKNKDVYDYQKIGELADLYQLLFYCYSLNSTYGGLVYPYYGELEPVLMNIESFRETNLYAFFIDFSKPIKARNEKFTNDVKKVLRVY